MYKLPNKCTIILAEIIARILKAIQLLIDEKHSNYILLRNSLSTIKNIKNNFHQGDMMTLIHNKLKEA